MLNNEEKTLRETLERLEQEKILFIKEIKRQNEEDKYHPFFNLSALDSQK